MSNKSAHEALPRKTILVLAKGFPPTTGGVEQYSQQVVMAYLRSGYDVVVMTQTDSSNGWRKVRTDVGDFTLWNCGRGSQPIVFARMIWTAITARRLRDLTRVHSTTWRVGIVATLAFRRASKVITIHGREVLNVPRLLNQPMHRAFRNADTVISVSHATELAAKRVIRACPDRWFVRHNGLSYRDEAIHSQERSPRVGLHVLSLSRLVPRKNVDITIRAVAAVVAEGFTGLQLWVAGTGPERERLDDLVTELGIQDHVRFLGYVADEDIPGLYRWADVFVHPHTHVGEGNDFEGFGLVIADAMSFGCTPIIGDIGGPRELVTDGETGFVVEGSSVGEVSDALRRLCRDPEEISRLGRSAQRHALAAFSWDAHIRPAIHAFGDVAEDRS
ncbi:glycosyltransferase family 4 protein [Microbacterium sp. USHLN272]|uniref:glycosyltransferase family 4 protein n=1 Tax=Microbacterium sp. USHLN272 TaxID=3081287 RepID=UPI003017EF06